MPVEYQIDLLVSDDTTTSTSYIDITATKRIITYIDTSKWVSPTFYFECVLRANYSGLSPDVPAKAHLYNVTDSQIVSGSEIYNTNNSYVRVRSNEIPLASGKEYKVHFKRDGDAINSTDIHAARIIVIDDISGGWTKGEEQIEIASPSSTTSSSAVRPTYSPVYLHDTSVRDGSVEAIFEVCGYIGTSGKTAYFQLWNITDSSEVVLLSTESTTPVRIRSSSIILTHGKEYCVRIYSSQDGKTTYLTGAKLILQQIGTPITKTYLRKTIGHHGVTDSDILNNNLYVYTYLDKSQFTGTLQFYHECTIHITSSNGTMYTYIWGNKDSNVAEVSTSLTTQSRNISSALTLSDTQIFYSTFKRDIEGTGYLSIAYLVISIQIAGPFPTFFRQ